MTDGPLTVTCYNYFIPKDTSMLYSSNQDFYAQMAAISAITLKGVTGKWLHENYRTIQNNSEEQFSRQLHKAMGYKASTVNEWEV